MRIVSIMLVTLMSSLAIADAPLERPVPVELGPKTFRDGDVIQIIDVSSTSPRLEQGDTVTVKGRVRLDSFDEARLCLYLTQTVGDGIEESDRHQEVRAKRGLRDFELKITIKHRGYLHITLYGTEDGKPFGIVYFGTAEQMQSAPQSLVQHYATK